MNPSEVKNILKQLNLSPNKKLGQNFLCDDSMTKSIIEKAEVTSADRILEIGPGLGSLTEMLIETGCSLTSCEIDAGYARYLETKFANVSNFTLLHSNFLKVDIPGPFNKVISNLPYYCASEMIFRCIDLYSPDTLCVMLQKEMAERIISVPGTPSYGAMTVMLGIQYQSRILFHIPPSSFFPSPDVVSSVLLMKRIEQPIIESSLLPRFSSLVKASFWGRRKTLVKACSSSPHLALERAILLDALKSAGINDSVRGESLSVEQFAELTRLLFTHEE